VYYQSSQSHAAAATSLLAFGSEMASLSQLPTRVFDANPAEEIINFLVMSFVTWRML
jgi:hypothetical protein